MCYTCRKGTSTSCADFGELSKVYVQLLLGMLQHSLIDCVVRDQHETSQHAIERVLYDTNIALRAVICQHVPKGAKRFGTQLVLQF